MAEMCSLAEHNCEGEKARSHVENLRNIFRTFRCIILNLKIFRTVLQRRNI